MSSQSSHSIRGCVLVICNSFQDTTKSIKEVCDGDTAAMKQLWGSVLTCDSFPKGTVNPDNADFIVHQDVSARRMVELLSNFAKHSSPTKYSYIAVVISSHGGILPEVWVEKWDPTGQEINPGANWKVICDDLRKNSDCYKNQKDVEVFFGNDFRPVREQKMKEMFYNNAAEALQNIPKIFILSYCRGIGSDFGVKHVKAMDALIVSKDSSTTPRVIPNKSAYEQVASILPSISDVLVVHATQRLYMTYGNSSGSLLVNAIENVFTRFAKKMHVVEMLTLVNQEMKNTRVYSTKDKKEVSVMSVFESTVVGNLYLSDDAKKQGELLASFSAMKIEDQKAMIRKHQRKSEEVSDSK